MIVSREFSINQKNMQETMREVVIRYILENSCNPYLTELKSDKLGTSNSIIN